MLKKSKYIIIKFILIYFLIAISANNLPAEYSGGIDTVYFFKPGKGQNQGQDSVYYPKNIFGIPSRKATEYIPESSAEELLSLGFNGEIILGFREYAVIDGEGPDFTVFENAFINPVNGKIFAEPAKVSVSSDGIEFYDFPFDSLTLQGCAGTKPTNGSQDLYNPLVSGGNSFDLRVLGLNYINYIKITDICELILKNPSHPFYDAIVSGFDLDAVVGLHLVPKQMNSVERNEDQKTNINYYLSESNIFITVQANEQVEFSLFDITGKVVGSQKFTELYYYDFSGLNHGVYIIILKTAAGVFPIKLCL